MLIMVSGPVSAETKEEEQTNIERLDRAAAALLRRGHLPLVGLHAARPVVVAVGVRDFYEAVMQFSLALAERCDAVLFIGDSPGALKERALFERRGRPVYTELTQVPASAPAAAPEQQAR